MIDYSGLPEHPNNVQEGLRRYIEHGVMPGGFLVAVLSNDLRTACTRADEANRHNLFDIVKWLYNYAPLACWGSRERVDSWIRKHHEAKEAQAS